MTDLRDSTLVTIDPSRLDEAVDVLCDAFADYPVMRYVIGPCGDEYEARLRKMITFFTQARLLNGDLVLGVALPDGRLVAAANMTRPGERAPSPALDPIRERLWQELGADARERYEELGRTWRRFPIARPHYHLNMIGVRRTHRRRGASRALLDALHDRSARAADSCGVTLTTETAANLALYQHFGYLIVGQAHAGPGFQTWAMFRPDPESGLGTEGTGDGRNDA